MTDSTGAVREFCNDFRAAYEKYGLPITSVDDPRLEALVATGTVASPREDFRATFATRVTVPQEATDLGLLWFAKLSGEVPEWPLEMPSWAQSVTIDPITYPEISIEAERVLSHGQQSVTISQLTYITVDGPQFGEIALERPEIILDGGQVAPEDARALATLLLAAHTYFDAERPVRAEGLA